MDGGRRARSYATDARTNVRRLERRYRIALEPEGVAESKDDGPEEAVEGEFDLTDAPSVDEDERALWARGERKILKVKLANLATLAQDVGPGVAAYGVVAEAYDDDATKRRRAFLDDIGARLRAVTKRRDAFCFARNVARR